MENQKTDEIAKKVFEDTVALMERTGVAQTREGKKIINACKNICMDLSDAWEMGMRILIEEILMRVKKSEYLADEIIAGKSPLLATAVLSLALRYEQEKRRNLVFFKTFLAFADLDKNRLVEFILSDEQVAQSFAGVRTLLMYSKVLPLESQDKLYASYLQLYSQMLARGLVNGSDLMDAYVQWPDLHPALRHDLYCTIRGNLSFAAHIVLQLAAMNRQEDGHEELMSDLESANLDVKNTKN